jgi:hypothetical protein
MRAPSIAKFSSLVHSTKYLGREHLEVELFPPSMCNSLRKLSITGTLRKRDKLPMKGTSKQNKRVENHETLEI